MSPIQISSTCPTHPLRHRFATSSLGFFSVCVILILGLRPILTTVVVADDLIGPFGMFIDAGPGISNYLKAGWRAASYGHFNYVGQLTGALTHLVWLELMLNGVRFSTIYFFTKFLIFLTLVFSASGAISAIGQLWSNKINLWCIRLLISLLMVASLQLHLVWSNDPVASYPMSGYASVVIGLFTLRLSAQLLRNPHSVAHIFFAPLILLFAMLYYEMNIALIPAIATLALTYLLSEPKRRSTAVRMILRIATIYAIPTIAVIALQLRNATESAAYEGTAIQLDSSIFMTFGKLLVSSLPFSSWHLAFDWIIKFPEIGRVVMPFMLFSVFVGVCFWVLFVTPSKQKLQSNRLILWVFPPLLCYWMTATAIQSSTVKVQIEATRIGSVYNFYAVGSTVIVIVLAILLYLVLQKLTRRIPKVSIFLFLIVLSLSQLFMNQAIQNQHFNMLPQTRNLLTSFSEQRPLAERCFSLQVWLTMGWPPYYSNSMASGLEAAYTHKFGESFCGRF